MKYQHLIGMRERKEIICCNCGQTLIAVMYINTIPYLGHWWVLSMTQLHTITQLHVITQTSYM